MCIVVCGAWRLDGDLDGDSMDAVLLPACSVPCSSDWHSSAGAQIAHWPKWWGQYALGVDSTLLIRLLNAPHIFTSIPHRIRWMEHIQMVRLRALVWPHHHRNHLKMWRITKMVNRTEMARMAPVVLLFRRHIASEYCCDVLLRHITAAIAKGDLKRPWMTAPLLLASLLRHQNGYNSFTGIATLDTLDTHLQKGNRHSGPFATMIGRDCNYAATLILGQ